MLKTIFPPRAGARKKGRAKKPATPRPQNPPKPRPQRYMRLYLEQEGLCFYCRQPMDLPNPDNVRAPLPPNRVTLEHLFAASSDRRTRKFVVAACHACNQERGSNYHWRDFMIRKIEHYWRP